MTSWSSVIDDDQQKTFDSALAEGKANRDRKDAHAARKDFLRHPVSRVLKAAQAGSIPTGTELDALQLDTEHRAKVERAISSLTEMRDRGEFAVAEDAAHDLADEIVGALPEPQRVSTYLNEDQPDERGPAELAADVKAW